MQEPIEVSPKTGTNKQLQDVREPPRPSLQPVGVSVPRRRRRSLFWPIALIAFGALLLLSNLGMIPATGWAVLWRFWPVALVALGIDVLLGRRSVAGAIASGILMLVLVGSAIAIALFAEQVPYLVELARPATLKVDHIEHPLGQIEEAFVDIDFTSAPAHLSALVNSSNLFEADIAYRGERILDVTTVGRRATVTLDTVLQGLPYGTLNFNDERQRWDIWLAPEVVLDLRLDGSSGSATFDLTGLAVSSLELDAGSGATELVLPSDRDCRGEIDGGSGSLTIRVPDDVGVRLHLEGGSGRFDPRNRLVLVSGDEDDGTWETVGFDAAHYQVELTVEQGSGALIID